MTPPAGSARTIAAQLIVALSLAATAAAQDKLALVGGMLLDGYDVPPLHHAAVLVEGDRIVAVGRAAEMEIPADAEVVDTRGRVMMPGMMDLHAHLAVLGHGEYGRWFSWIDEEGVDIEDVMEISAKQLLLAGVTTAVDLGAPLEASLAVRDRIARGEAPGARLLMAGPWITRRVSFWPENYQIGISSPEEASAAVERLAEAGVDVIKAWVGLTREDYEAIADTAHRHGIRVHAHVYDPGDVRNALEAGIDVLTHAGSAGTPPYEPDLVRDIVVAGRPVVITGAHRVWVFPATVDFPERLQDPRFREDLPDAMYAELQQSFENFHTLPYFQTTARQMFFGDASLGQWIDAGSVMGMGTDSGTPMNFHTEALWRELKAHVDLGMTPMEAIVAATRVNARILGLADDLGTIEPGKIADIVVLRGDPRFSITALDDPELVVKDGRVYRRD
ncbi:MAG: amidohydrolase family protein [Acidobacteria bacterium]|nr:amidohydrolase family protein [Acidobacteriota bacterium]